MQFYAKSMVTTILLLLALNGTDISANSNDAYNPNYLIGTWSYSGGSIEFSSDGTGVMRLKNLNSTAPCPEGSLNYTSMTICGEVQDTPDSDGPKNYSIQGYSLQFAGLTWTRQ